MNILKPEPTAWKLVVKETGRLYDITSNPNFDSWELRECIITPLYETADVVWEIIWNNFVMEVQRQYGMETLPKNFLGSINEHKRSFMRAVNAQVS